MRSGCRLSQKLALFAALAFAASPAAALSMSPNPVDLIFEGLAARVTLVGSTTGLPAGGITLGGAVAPADEVLLFTVEYIQASISPLAFVGVQRSGGVWSAVGWVPGANVDWSSTFGGVSSAATIISNTLDTGLVSDAFFVSAASLPIGTTLDFSFQGYHGVPLGMGSATVVPEPATLALLAGGLVLLARGRRD